MTERPTQVRLRPTEADDIPALYAFQRDPEANALAGTHPRDREAFDARWAAILADPPGSGVIPRVILADGALVGSINIVRAPGVGDAAAPPQDAIGYWIDRAHWGRGIATRAIARMLAEVAARPLVAHVAADNVASLRALQRNGFVVIARAWRDATERHAAREVLTLTTPAAG